MSELDAAILLASKRMVQVQEIRDPNFPIQDRFVLDPSRRIAGFCTRRAGKSTGLGLRFFRTLRRHPGAFCPYIALTRESAKNIMWPVLQEIDEKYQLGARFTLANLTVTLPEGGRIQLFGADMKNFIRRLKGIKTPGVGIDECQDFGPHLRELVLEVLEPATVDYEDSWIALTGTAGPIPMGLFFEITGLRLHGYSVHEWGLYDNPYLRNPRQFVEDLKKKHSWDDLNPTFIREYGGHNGRSQWITDVDSLLIKYFEDRCHYDGLPPGAYVYLLGVDLGHRDSDALAVLAWSERSPHIYLVEEHITQGQDITALSNQIRALMDRYDFAKIVMDEGALGKKIAEEIRRRKQLPILPADKMRKMENVAFLNDWMRKGCFKASKSSRFAKDSYLVHIDYEKSTPDRLIVKKGHHSDIIDAVLYAFKESPAYTYQEPVKRPAYGSEEWAKQEVDEMEKAAIEKALRDQENRDGGWDWGSSF